MGLLFLFDLLWTTTATTTVTLTLMAGVGAFVALEEIS